MRVTIISKICVVGTYQRKLEEIASYSDVDLSVVVPPYWLENGRRLELERAYTSGYTLIVAPMALNGRFHEHFYPTLGSILQRTQPNLCHIDEEPYNLATYLALRAAKKQSAKTLFFTWQNLARTYPPPYRWMENYVYHHCDGALAGNHAAKTVLEDKGYSGPVAVVPQFGVDPEIFCPQPNGNSKHPFTVGYAGRLVEEKGLDTLTTALEQLQGDWRCVFYGDGPLAIPLRERFHRAGLQERVTFTPRVASIDMPKALSEMNVVVLPSLSKPNWKEQFGRVLIEAMACQVPVIGSDSGEIPQVIGDAGMIFPEGDATSLHNLLAQLYRQPDLRTAWGLKGRQRVLKAFTQTRIAERTVDFYRSIIDSTLPST